MSTTPNSTKSRLWVDGDAFRCPVGTPLPTTDLFTASSFTGFDAFGAIQAGFEITAAQDTSNMTVWNAQGAYRKKKGEVVKSVALRPVDQSKAAILTRLRGGSVAETETGSGIFEFIEADDEEFGLLLVCRDPGYGSQAYFIERGTLDAIPTDTINDDALYGHDLVVTALTPEGGGQPIRTFSSVNPLVEI